MTIFVLINLIEISSYDQTLTINSILRCRLFLKQSRYLKYEIHRHHLGTHISAASRPSRAKGIELIKEDDTGGDRGSLGKHDSDSPLTLSLVHREQFRSIHN